MLLTLAGLILTAANYSCDLATFSNNGNTVQLNGAICTLSDSASNNSLEIQQCNQQSFTTLGTMIGLFLPFFYDTTQMCLSYYVPNETTWGAWITSTSAVVFSGLRWMFGIIAAFFWLALSMCCPAIRRAIHKQVSTIVGPLCFVSFPDCSGSSIGHTTYSECKASALQFFVQMYEVYALHRP
jgi:hypothetical protein